MLNKKCLELTARYFFVSLRFFLPNQVLAQVYHRLAPNLQDILYRRAHEQTLPLEASSQALLRFVQHCYRLLPQYGVLHPDQQQTYHEEKVLPREYMAEFVTRVSKHWERNLFNSVRGVVPCLVHKHSICRNRQNLATKLLNLSIIICHLFELCWTNKCKVCWIEKKNEPLTTIIREFNFLYFFIMKCFYFCVRNLVPNFCKHCHIDFTSTATFVHIFVFHRNNLLICNI